MQTIQKNENDKIVSIRTEREPRIASSILTEYEYDAEGNETLTRHSIIVEGRGLHPKWAEIMAEEYGRILNEESKIDAARVSAFYR